MKNTTLTAVLLLISFATYGQQAIVNELTSDHQAIAGTKVNLIIPEGFIAAVNFLGLQQEETGSSIMVLEIPGPYSETSKGITKENMLSQGVVVDTIDQLTINGLPAILVTGTQSAYGSEYTKYVLVFGSEEETVLVNGVFPDGTEVDSEAIKKSMLSVYYDADMVVDPFNLLDFSVDVSDTKLKYGKSMAKSLIFSVDGNVPTLSSDKTNLIVGKSFSEVATSDKEQFCENRLRQMPIEIVSIEYTKPLTIDGLSGYEIYAKAKTPDTEDVENTYQVILFDEGMYYILFGSTNDESDDSVTELRQAVMTFKRK